MTPSFQIGDAVTWTSQAAGYSSTKFGTVEEVVPAMGMPSRDRFPQLYRNAGVGQPRDHVSFVVRVPGKTAKAVGTLYWPRVSGLSGQPGIEEVVAAAQSVVRDGGWVAVAGATASGRTTTLRAIARGLVEGQGEPGLLSIQEGTDLWAEGCNLTVIDHDRAETDWPKLADIGIGVIALNERFGPIRVRLVERVLSGQSSPMLVIAFLAASGEIAVHRLRDHCPSLRGRPVLAVTVAQQSNGARSLRYIRQDAGLALR